MIAKEKTCVNNVQLCLRMPTQMTHSSRLDQLNNFELNPEESKLEIRMLNLSVWCPDIAGCGAVGGCVAIILA